MVECHSTEVDGDRSPNTKAVTGHRTPKIRTCKWLCICCITHWCHRDSPEFERRGRITRQARAQGFEFASRSRFRDFETRPRFQRCFATLMRQLLVQQLSRNEMLSGPPHVVKEVGRYVRSLFADGAQTA